MQAQSVGYVRYDHPVYGYLDRMDALNLIENYNSFELPKTRNEVSTYLTILSKKMDKLDYADKELLYEFLREFEYNIERTTTHYSSLIDESFIFIG